MPTATAGPGSAISAASGSPRISAASRERGLPYAQFAHGLTLAGVGVNRKQLAELAVHDPGAFDCLVDRAREALSAGSSPE